VARFGGADNDRATSLAVEPDGNVLVAGKWLDKGGIWHGPRGGFQTSIARQWSWSNTCEATVPTEAAFLLRVAPNGSQVGGAALIGAVGGDLAGWMNHEGVMPCASRSTAPATCWSPARPIPASRCRRTSRSCPTPSSTSTASGPRMHSP